MPNSVNDPIEIKTLDDVRKEPYQLPAGFFWDTLDINHAGTVSISLI